MLRIIKSLSWVIFLVIFSPQQPSAAIPANRTSGDLMNLDLSVFVAGKPINLILVEKDFQRVRVLRHDGRLKVVAEYFAATGENFGQKESEGDSKTPEGIYFITKKYTDNKLTIFGTRAYHLNYPNISDTMEGRGGSGIYIHGTNKKLRVNSTNGCVTLNNYDLDGLANFLNVGRTPVIIVSSLLKLSTGKVEHPSLTENNYFLAKEMLVPEEDGDDVEFTSLYLVRIGKQSVAVGEYVSKRAGQSKQNFSAAYLDVSPEGDWLVLGPGPAAMPGTEVELAAQNLIAEKNKEIRTAEKGEESVYSTPPSLNWKNIWMPGDEDVYLGWYRDSLQGNIIENSSESPEISGGRGQQKNFILGAFLLATGFSIGASFYFIKVQMRRMDKIAEEISLNQSAEGVQPKNKVAPVQFEILREDINAAKERLHQLQEKIQEEAKSMGSNDLQARIEDLEKELADKQAEVEQLNAEKAAIKLKGMSNLSGQVEELGLMSKELKDARAEIDKSRADLDRIPILEEMVTTQQAEIQQLHSEKVSIQMNAAATSEFQEEINTLQGKLSQYKSKNEELYEALARLPELDRELTRRGNEIDRLLLENKALQEQENNGEDFSQLQDKLANANLELREARGEIDQLSAELSRLPELDEALKKYEHDIERLFAENKALHEKAEKSQQQEMLIDDLQSQLSDAVNNLQESKKKADELSSAMARLTDMEREIDSQADEIETLRLENKAIQEDRNQEFEEVVHGLQEKVNSLQDVLLTEEERRKALEEDAARLPAISEELTAAKEEIQALISANEELKEEAAGAEHESKIDDLRSKITLLQEALAAEEEKGKALEEDAARLPVISEQLASSKEEIQALITENEELKEGASGAEHESIIDDLRSEISSLQEALSAEEERSKALQEDAGLFSGVASELAAAKAEIWELQNENKQLREAGPGDEDEDIEDLRSQIASLKEELLAEEEKSKALQEDAGLFSGVASELAAAKSEIWRLKSENKAMDGEPEAMDELRRQLAVTRAKLAEAQANAELFSDAKGQQVSLEKEVNSQAEKIEELTAENRSLKAVIEDSDGSISQELITLREQLSLKQTELSEALAGTEILADAKGQLKVLEDELQHKNGEIEELTAENKSLKEVIEDSDVSISQELDSLREQLSARQAELTEALAGKELLADAKNQLMSLEEELESQAEKIEELTAENRSLRDASEESDGSLSQELDSLREQLSASQTELSEAQAGKELLADAKNQLMSLEDELESQAEKIEELTAENRSLRGAVEESDGSLSQELESLREQLSASQTELSEAQAGKELLADAKNQLMSLEDELESQAEKIEELTAENRSLRDAVEESDSSLSQELESLRKQLSASQTELSEAQAGKELLADAKSHLISLEDELESQEEKIDQLSKENMSLKEALEQNDISLELEKLQEELAERSKELSEANENVSIMSEAQRKLSELESKFDEQVKINTELISEKAQLKELSEHREDIEELRQQLTDKEKEVEDLHRSRVLLSEAKDRILALEDELDEKLDENKRLALENSELKDTTDSHGESVELEDLRKQLAEKNVEVERFKESNLLLSKAKDRILELEDIIDEQKAEKERLMTKDLSAKASEEIEGLKRQLAESQTELASAQKNIANLSEIRAEMLSLEKELNLQTKEKEQLLAELAQLQKSAESQDLHDELEKLKQELRENQEELEQARESSRRLISARNRLEDLEAEIAEKDKENIRLTDELSKLSRGEGTINYDQKIAEMESLRSQLTERLAEMNSIKESEAMLAEANNRLRTLEIELGERARENKKLYDELNGIQGSSAKLGANDDLIKENEDLRRKLAAIAESHREGKVGAHHQARITELEELVMSSQVEVKSLTNQLRALKEKAGEEVSNEAAKLNITLNYLEEDLERERSLRGEAEQHAMEAELKITPMKDEIEQLRAAVGELKHKLAESEARDEGVALIKGSHYLPGDVLKKWISK